MKKLALSMFLALACVSVIMAQCETWNNSPQKDAAEEAHSVYRQMVKSEQYDEAYEYWKKAYDIAPAADGLRDFHYRDGIKIFMDKFQKETDEAKKKEYKDMVYKLYDQMVQCYENRVIKIKDCDDDCYTATIGNVYASRAYDMYYFLRAPYSENLEVAEKALRMGGITVDYSVYEPALAIATHQFQKGQIDAEKVQELYHLIEASANFNIENDEEYGEYYDAASKRAFATVKPIESDVFDCEYFLKKLKPKYEENPTDFDVLKYVYNTLKSNGCPENDEFLTKIKGEYETLAAQYNASVRAELEAKNPALAANRLYKEGNYEGAAAKYQEAINMEADNLAKSKHYFSLASIQFRKLKKYGDARASAKKAYELNPSSGKPLMLIGDMYASSARSCGDSWNQRLAILAAIDKYKQAKSADSSVGTDASARISKYASSRPADEEIFMRNLKPGSTAKVGCWIGETVRL